VLEDVRRALASRGRTLDVCDVRSDGLSRAGRPFDQRVESPRNFGDRHDTALFIETRRNDAMHRAEQGMSPNFIFLARKAGATKPPRPR